MEWVNGKSLKETPVAVRSRMEGWTVFLLVIEEWKEWELKANDLREGKL